MITIWHARDDEYDWYRVFDSMGYEQPWSVVEYASGYTPARYPVPAIQYRVTWDSAGIPTWLEVGLIRYVGRYKFTWYRRLFYFA